MIPILYEHNATTFTSFGIGALKDTTSCEVTEERNGKYELVLKYPLTGQLYSEIQKERIIRVQVNDNKSIESPLQLVELSQFMLNIFLMIYQE